MNEADEEFDRARQKSQGRFRSAFEAIFEKYGQIDEDDDIINLETGDFIVDNGRVRNSRVIELGDLLRYSDQPSSPLLDGSSYPPSSPELLSNNQIERKKEQSARNGNHSDQDIKEVSQTSDEESGSIDLDFASYINKYSTSSGHASGAGPLWKRRRKTESDEEEEESIDYDSSDSLAADQEATPIEMYFTNSIEQYLEKLRQQMSAPQPIRSHTQSPTATTTTNTTASDQQIHDDEGFDNGGAIASRSYARTTRMYEIPSSPRTMTSRGSSDGAHTRPFASSPASSVYFGEDAGISESSSISSTHSRHSPHAMTYSLPPGTSTAVGQQQRTAEYQDSMYFDTNLHHSAAIGYSSVEYEGEEESEDPVSEEEPIEALNKEEMKQRFSALDVRATVTALQQRITGLRLQGIYDVNSKTFLFKFTKPDHKELVLVESGIRLHTTDYTRDKSITPSSFCMKLRKHLRARRLTAVRQIGMDRVVDFEFAVAAGPQNEGTYHILCEFYASGNIILTDYRYQILALLRVVRLDGVEATYAVGKEYSLPGAREIEPATKEEMIEWLKKAGPKDSLKRHLATFGAYGPALAEHAILRAKLSPTLRVATSVDLDLQSPQVASLVEAYNEAYEVVQKLKTSVYPGYITFLESSASKEEEGNDEEDDQVYDDFGPWLFEQFKSKPYKEFPSFADAADVFFSNIEAQKLKSKAHQQETAAERKLQAIKDEHEGRVSALEKAHRKTEEQARRIEMNLEFVDQAIMIIRQAVAAGMDWKELEDLVADQKTQGNPVAERIVRLNLSANQITLELDDPEEYWDESESDNSTKEDEEEEEEEEARKEFSGPMSVDLDIFESAFSNAQRYYNSRRQAGIKHAKTLAVSSQALQSAEQKIRSDLKATKITATVSQQRKPLWFEKFSWFLSSDGYLVIAGHDMQQNELLVKRHLRPGDAYVHADINGAASVIVKNKMAASAPEAASGIDKKKQPSDSDENSRGNADGSSAESIPPSTLFQAGVMSVCQSRAWDAKIVTSAWWVEAHQVSKTAPTGEYLTTGSFMIRGKKRFLPPAQLVYGFGFMFRLADDESIARHANARQQRLNIMEENRRAAEGQSTFTRSDSHISEPPLADDESAGGDRQEAEEMDTNVEGAPNPSATKSTDIDFGAVRRKYNLDEIDDAVEDAFEDTNDNNNGNAGDARPSDGRRHLSAKERRDQRKGKETNNKPAIDAADGGSGRQHGERVSKKEQRLLDAEEKHEKANKQQQQNQQQQKRGKKGKMKKMKDKYAEQDDEDRDLRMALLGSMGKSQDAEEQQKKQKKTQKKQQQKTSRSTTPVGNLPGATDSAAPVTATDHQPPPSIVDQLRALSTKEDNASADVASIEANDDNDEDEEGAVDSAMIDQLGVLDTLTSAPLAGDNLSFAIPVCAPYSALSSYKYRVKLVTGAMKKGKACKMALGVAVSAADDHIRSKGGPKAQGVGEDAKDAERRELETILATREKELMKAVPEQEMISQMLSKVKVTAPNMESIRQKSKTAAKNKAKKKQQQKAKAEEE
ncbi:hypothetical protein IWW48_002872 [Coemansia sp. RSA 1200]|nr:hypothetical protein IWW48_002872 [Coemansia sp. RSA 1200]